MGFLDDTWFHRSYWVYGRSFAGGHNGYYQAGKFAPSGRILVFDDEQVYGYGRKPQYLKWTTTLEHRLFSTSKQPPIVDPKLLRRGRGTPMIRVEKSKSLNPSGKSLIVEAWVKSARPNGVILAHGGPAAGYALIIRNGQPQFVVRRAEKTFSATAAGKIVGKWTHLVGVLNDKKQVRIYVNGKMARSWDAPGFLTVNPAQALEVGADDKGAVGNYRSPNGFNGLIDEVRVFHGTMTDAEIQARVANPAAKTPKTATLVLSMSFTNGAKDGSGNKNHGKIEAAQTIAGKIGKAMKFQKRGGQSSGSYVKHKWTEDVPLYVRAMVLADKTLFIAGPPDIIDEEKTFAQLKEGDDKVQAKLIAQDNALAGKSGGRLWAVSKETGKKLGEIRLPHLPVWDGMAAANGSLYITTLDGQVIRIRGE
jgi:hypothetical protein